MTDLESYRVYYGASDPPCPGSSSFVVASPTPSPPPNQTVTFRLTGLSAGALYFVSITAVDIFGNESDCSAVASAVARIDFAVAPATGVNFGSVSLGNSADQVFTVSNTGGGTVSGGVSTSGPFSAVAGSPFSLAGLGATETVTVRFRPITAATATANVNFTADGDVISRIVTGTGIGSDITPPTVAITAPTSNPIYNTNSFALTLRGTASDNVGVSQVTWSNSAGGNGTATGTTSWTASGIVLQVGTNVLTVTAWDGSTNSAAATLTVTATPLAFTDDPLAAESTVVKAAHIVEVRAAIDAVRLAVGLAPFDWTDPTLTPESTPVKAAHLADLRTALDQAYEAAGRAAPLYTDPDAVAEFTLIKAIHLNELRRAVRGL